MTDERKEAEEIRQYPVSEEVFAIVKKYLRDTLRDIESGGDDNYEERVRAVDGSFNHGLRTMESEMVFVLRQRDSRIKELEEALTREAMTTEADVFYDVDGDQITAKRGDFTNLQECPCGFGYTEQEALADLIRQEKELS